MFVLYQAVVNGFLPGRWEGPRGIVPAPDVDSKVGMALPTDHRRLLEERKGSWRGNRCCPTGTANLAILPFVKRRVFEGN